MIFTYLYPPPCFACVVDIGCCLISLFVILAYNEHVVYTAHMKKKPFLQISFLSGLQGVNGWHDLDNTEYDCWPSNSPNDYNMISCGGESFSAFVFPICVCVICK